ncbi:MAG: hypothetical protein JO032_08410 [Alphaproteobacteria bacterium]|nr:hypothetical protein [Alphaproteobacteria bacterium]MBV9552798.1 hypothetical protein [Alphaproteobacteria bacterium]
MQPLRIWIAAAGAALLLAVVIAVAIGNWGAVGGSGITLNGWIALILGVLLTTAVGVGLMALVFISSRRGFDEPPGKDR